MTNTVTETKTQRLERLKREKNPWEGLEEIRRFARRGFNAIPPEWIGTYFRWWGVYTQGDGGSVTGGTNGEGKALHRFMVRIRIPNGILSSRQLRTIAGLTRRYANGIADLAVRQYIQLHWVTIEALPDLLEELWNIGLNTTGACGDVVRNVTGCPVVRWPVEEREDRLPGFDQDLKLHVTGCPSGCGQHWIADIGIEGKKFNVAGQLVDAYYFCVGGSLGLIQVTARPVGYRHPATQAPEAIERLLRHYLALRHDGEDLRRFFARHSETELRRFLAAEFIEAAPCDLPTQHAQELLVTSLFPMFVKAAGRACLVVGAGGVSEQKIASLIGIGARIRVVAFEATAVVQGWATAGQIELALRAFADGGRGILCDVVDVPDLCDFYYPAVVRRGDLQIAISTGGQSPSLAQRLRKYLERQFLPRVCRMDRAAWRGAEIGAGQRPESRTHIGATSLICPRVDSRSGHIGRTKRKSEGNRSMKGTVYLVGASPGNPELLTLKAARLLRAADAVLDDDLVSANILQLTSPAAQIYKVGKRCGTTHIRQEQINFLMIAMAKAGLQVVRFKDGDALIFGQAGDEIQALRRANIPYEIVSGVTSALAAAASAGIPLTRRDISSAVVLLTFHQAPGHNDINWDSLVASDATLVIDMRGRNYAAVPRPHIVAGVTPETPCIIISRATTPSQQIDKTTLLDLSRARSLRAHTLLIVGEVVRQAQDLANTISPFLSYFTHQAGASAIEEQIA